MSDTPKTDAAESFTLSDPNNPYGIVVAVRSEFARKFERDARATVKALLDRLESTQGQKFYDQVKPELEAVRVALEI